MKLLCLLMYIDPASAVTFKKDIAAFIEMAIEEKRSKITTSK